MPRSVLRPCPRCGDREVKLSRPRSLERLLALCGFRPYRCHHCFARFWRFGSPMKGEPVDGSVHSP
jgi:uncharacterized protein with PIN domain